MAYTPLRQKKVIKLRQGDNGVCSSTISESKCLSVIHYNVAAVRMSGGNVKIVHWIRPSVNNHLHHMVFQSSPRYLDSVLQSPLTMATTILGQSAVGPAGRHMHLAAHPSSSTPPSFLLQIIYKVYRFSCHSCSCIYRFWNTSSALAYLATSS